MVSAQLSPKAREEFLGSSYASRSARSRADLELVTGGDRLWSTGSWLDVSTQVSADLRVPGAAPAPRPKVFPLSTTRPVRVTLRPVRNVLAGLTPRVSQFWRGLWAGGHAGTGGWIWQRDEDSINRSGLLTM